MSDARYLKALRFDALTPFYDFVSGLLLPETAFKQSLIDQASIQSGHRVLDVGCGTATLAIMIKIRYPAARVTGLDGDPKILQLAHHKVIASKADVALTLGLSSTLPYRNDCFDRVVASLFLHHLTREGKIDTLRELYRVMRPGGELHVADWGAVRSRRQRLGAWLEQCFDGVENTVDHFHGCLPALLAAADFQEARETGQYKTLVAGLSLYQAKKA